MEIDVTTNAELVERLRKIADEIYEDDLVGSEQMAIADTIDEAADAIERLSSGGGWRTIWVGVDSTGGIEWTTVARTEIDCRALIGARVVEEGDILLVPRLIDVKVPAPPGASSGEVASPAVEAARRQLRNALRLCEKDGSAMVSVPFRVDELRALLAAPSSPKDET